MPSDPTAAPLAGRRALITAASSGIGKATAAHLRVLGAEVFITGTGTHTAQTAEQVGAAGYVLADFTHPAGATVAAAAALETLEQIDILVVNTGGPPPSAFADLTDDDWLSAYHLILGSAISLSRAVVPSMAPGGRVIYLTSTAGVVRPVPGLHLSNVLRAGVAALSASLAVEYGPRGLTFNTIAPGPIDTARRRQIMEFQAQRRGLTAEEVESQERDGLPMRRFGQPAEIAAMVAYLAMPQAGFITGQVHVADGGMTLR